MAAIHDLLAQVQDQALRERIEKEIDRLSKTKKFGLVFEEHMPECTPLYDVPVKKGVTVAKKTGPVNNVYEIAAIVDDIAYCVNKVTQEREEVEVKELVTVAQFGESVYPYLKPIDSICNAPDSDLWHTLIEADNYHALQLLEYLYAEKVDCIYIDPPYNTGAKDWKYNNDYVDSADVYRHSKWLSMMKKRLIIAKHLLNPCESVLIVAIDEKEYLHLGCLLEELFPDANMQMITNVISRNGTSRENEFSRVEEYLFICRFGTMGVTRTNDNMLSTDGEGVISRVWFNFMRTSTPRSKTKGQFFPIYIDTKQKKIVEIGEALAPSESASDVPSKEGLVSVFPIKDDGSEATWGAVPKTTRELLKNGYLRVGTYDKKTNRWNIQYVRGGDQKRILSGEIEISGKAEDGSLILTPVDATKRIVFPKTVWNRKSHDATEHGTRLLKQILPGHVFSYPKSLYAVYDTLKFFVADKPNALILDFFAGSGTTLHAVNLLNNIDGGKRRCILVTNNEVSNDEAKILEKKGFKPGDEEWENHGVAREITWPRTICSIKGVDINGKKLKSKYVINQKDMSKGLRSNVAYFKLGFLDRTAVALGRQFIELLPVLWLKAGAYGKCPLSYDNTDVLILPENHFAVLINERKYIEFSEYLTKYPEIETLYFVTDSEAGYRELISQYSEKNTFQLYRDYLDNFRISVGR